MRNKKYFLLLLFLMLANLPIQSYWHHIYDHTVVGDGMNVTFAIVGDSNNIYAGLQSTQHARVIHSSDLGKTWDTLFVNYKGFDIADPPFRSLVGLEHPAPGYMYLLFSEVADDRTDDQPDYKTTGIMHIDERTGERLDSILIESEVGAAAERDFSMYDSLNGFLFSYPYASITRDGWHSFTQHNMTDIWYGEESKVVALDYFIRAPVMLSPDSVIFMGNHLLDSIGTVELTSFHLMIIGEGDTTFTFEPLGHGYNIESTDDSTALVTTSSDISHKRALNFALINDSIWLYIAPGKDTGYGQCQTLEIFKTVNRGQTFRQVCLMDLKAYGLSKIAFKDSLNGIAAGNSAVLTTSDCGETWQVSDMFYNKDWSEEVTFPIWNPHICYVEDMTFLGVFAKGIFKYESEFGVGVHDEQGMGIPYRKIYPNPATSGGVLHIDLPQMLACHAYIFDVDGKEVDNLDFFGSSFRLRESLSPGAYFIVVEAGGEIIAREKFIVE